VQNFDFEFWGVGKGVAGALLKFDEKVAVKKKAI
jgi:hypothetical protein